MTPTSSTTAQLQQQRQERRKLDYLLSPTIITPARISTFVGVLLTQVAPGASDNLRLQVAGALIAAYVLGYALFQAVKHHALIKHGSVDTAVVKSAVFEAITAVREADRNRA